MCLWEGVYLYFEKKGDKIAPLISLKKKKTISIRNLHLYHIFVFVLNSKFFKKKIHFQLLLLL